MNIKCNISVVVAIAVLLAACGAFAAPGAVSNAKVSAQERAATRAAVNNLLATVDMNRASERPRLGKDPDGSLFFFGAPPNAAATVDASRGKATPTEKAVGFLRQHAVAFGIKSPAVTFDLQRVKTDHGRTYARLQQKYGELPVFCGETIVQLSADGYVEAVISDIAHALDDLDNGKIPVLPSVDAEAAVSEAIDEVTRSYEARTQNAGTKSTEESLSIFRRNLTAAPGTTLFIYDPTVVGSVGSACLVWKVTVFSQTDATEKHVVLVDAASRKVALMYPLVYTALERVIKDQENDEELEPVIVREEGDPQCGIEDADTVYDYFGDVYDFYSSSFNRDSIDDEGLPLVGTVRVCGSTACDDQCPCPNAYWDGESRQMSFGEGYVADDVIGHELTHGVTSHESGLIYLNQSGAINESLSDVFGEFVDLTNGAGLDTSEVRWLLGEDVPGGAMRNMKDPPASASTACPDRMSSQYFFPPVGPNTPEWLLPYLDWGGVHINSGVNNKLCYLLVDGTDGEPGGQFNGRTVAGMGISLIADLYYECQTNLLTSGASYRALYYALEQAALNLELSPAQRENINEACRAVEIRPESFISVRGEDGRPVVRLTSEGNILILSGADIFTNQTITLNSGVDELVIRDDQGDPLAVVDSSSGNVYLKGDLRENVQTMWTMPDCAMIVRNDEEPVACITRANYFDVFIGFVPAGSLILDGWSITVNY